tara:strand:+ start:585 stop:1208 length:624 start_codon:yes stop_codon:yes gene_type:complete
MSINKKITKYKLSERDSVIHEVDGGDVGKINFVGNGNFIPGGVVSTSTTPQTNAITTNTVTASSANTNIGVGESGKTFILNASSASSNPTLSSCHTLTLPAVADAGAGWNVKIIVGDIAAQQTASIVTNGGEDKIMGQLVLASGSNAAATTLSMISDANADAIQLEGANEASEPGIQEGSVIDVVSNGSLFFVNGKLNGTGSSMSTT